MKFRILSELVSNTLENDTKNKQYILIPRLIEQGEYAGKYALPEKIMTDIKFQEHWDIILQDSPNYVEVNIDEVWPNIIDENG